RRRRRDLPRQLADLGLQPLRRHPTKPTTFLQHQHHNLPNRTTAPLYPMLRTSVRSIAPFVGLPASVDVPAGTCAVASLSISGPKSTTGVLVGYEFVSRAFRDAR